MTLTNQALQIGPLVLSWNALIAFAAISSGIWAGTRRGACFDIDAAPTLYRGLLIGIVAARLGFVWQLRDVYLAHPFDIADIRDGGWAIEFGLTAACLYGLYVTRMRRALRGPLLVASSVAMAVSVVGAISILAMPRPAQFLPTEILTSIDGHDLALTTFTGKPTVVNLWASWCAPCRREMPVLERAQEAHPDVNFVFVDQGESKATIDAYLRTENLSVSNVLLDPRLQTGNALGYQALPTTLFFDAKGKLIDTRIGALSPATLIEHLTALGGSAVKSSTNLLKATP